LSQVSKLLTCCRRCPTVLRGEQAGQKARQGKASKHASKRVHACACARAHVCVRVRVSVCACACARARARPNGRAARRGPRRGWERTPQPCVRRRQSRITRGRVPGVGRVVVVTPREVRPRHPVAGGEHRRARRCSPSGGGGWKCRRLAPRHAMRPRTHATPSPPPRWRSREAARANRWSSRGSTSKGGHRATVCHK